MALSLVLPGVTANPDRMTVEDREYLARLQSVIPRRRYRRTLAIGCGKSFVTLNLPGKEVSACDSSEAAIEWARHCARKRSDASRFHFFPCSLFDLKPGEHGIFDLVVAIEVLYAQNIGTAWSLVNDIVDSVLQPGGILLASHISEWCKHRFPYLRVLQSFYSYRGYVRSHEVFLK
jgi:2-polyprenyl-3-methyl-5-hydroxy-6-metoxy-1,4-benzoquinol methylase